MCFKPKDVPSKKVVLVELERAKNALEQENSALKLKLKDLQEHSARALKDRDSLSGQKADLEAQLQQRSAHTAQLLTQVGYLRSNLTSRLQELLDQHLSGGANETSSQLGDDSTAAISGPKPHHQPSNKTAAVHVMQADCLDNGECNDGPGALQKAAAAAVSIIDTGDEDRSKLSVQQQLDREVALLAQTHAQVINQAQKLSSQLRQAESDQAALRADVTGVRRRLEQAEANAGDQQEVLLLRCTALEQENEQLTGMSQDMQKRLEEAEGELSASKKQWAADAAQLSRQTTDLSAANEEIRSLKAQMTAAGLKVQKMKSPRRTPRSSATGGGQGPKDDEPKSSGRQCFACFCTVQEATAKAAELQTQVKDQTSALDAAKSAVKEREAEATTLRDQLATVQAEARQLQRRATELQTARDAMASELHDLSESKREATEAVEALRTQLADTQGDLAAAREQLAIKTQTLADTEAQLQECREALTATSDRLTRALEELAGNESRLAEANSQVMTTKQSVISTAKQLAGMAKEHSGTLSRLHSLESEAATLREQLNAARDAEAALRGQADGNGTAAREAREAAASAAAEVQRLHAAYEGASADLRRKVMLLTAIARMADKGPAAAAATGSRGSLLDSQAADPADGYGTVVSEARLRLKVCESPLPLLSALTAGILDSSKLQHLALDMDTSREVTWEKAGLRICCLAAAIGLNNSLQTLQLGGWTWGELGNGTALPFLALGGGGAGGMLRSVRLATNLFDVEAAAMLKDLLAAGLVDLAMTDCGEEGGAAEAVEGSRQQGTLLLYSGNERLDGWYLDMLRLARHAGSSSSSFSPSSSTQQSTVSRDRSSAGGAGADRTSAVSSSSHVHLHSDDRLSAPCTLAPVSSIRSSNSSHVSSTVVLSGGTVLDGGSSGAAATTTTTTAAAAAGPLECDLSAEALESHHMVLVMAVLLTCPGLRRLRLDGNKLGDGGAALLALGLSANTGLKELNLSRNGIRAAGARSLARCLEGSNSALLRLDLSGQRMEGLGAAGAEAMAQALRTNRTLEDVNLSSCGLIGATAACFAGAIRAAGAVRPASAGPAPSTSSSSASLASAAGAEATDGHSQDGRESFSGSSSGRNSGGGNRGAGGALRRLALAGNGMDAATAKMLHAAAAERPGLALSL